MNLPSSKAAVHRAWLYRILLHICDNSLLVDRLRFKGGTCASMLGYLDRFSVDLDFDYVGNVQDLSETSKELESIFKLLELEIKDKSKKVPQYFLKYPAPIRERNTVKVDITFPAPKSNQYQVIKLVDIDRFINSQTIETMFSNKMVALIDRYEKNGSIAGRDIYDIHYFFMKGYSYNIEVIEERRLKPVQEFFKELISFIEDKISLTVINQDLNMLLPIEQFKKIRNFLKDETLMYIRQACYW